MSNASNSPASSTPPIQTASIEQLNKVFSALSEAYEKTFKHYARLEGESSDALGDTHLRGAVERTHNRPKAHPDFMREFLGFGIVPSFVRRDPQQKNGNENKNAEQSPPHGATNAGQCPFLAKKKQEQSASEVPTALPPPSKVGLAISDFHIVMRLAAKSWGEAFDKSKLDPEFRGILDWLEATDKVTCPDCIVKKYGLPPDPNKSLESMTHEEKEAFEQRMLAYSQPICDDVMARFKALESVPVFKIEVTKEGKAEAYPASIRNSTTIVETYDPRSFEGGDLVRITSEVPAAAIVWAAKPASQSIMGRAEGTPLKVFLQQAFGIGNEAGRKMSVLHALAPEIFADYDRVKIASSIEKQKYWLKTAAAVAEILGNKSHGYEDALALIGENAQSIKFKSANKAAVLLYACAERLGSIQADATEQSLIKTRPSGKPNPQYAISQEITRRLDNKQSGLTCIETIQLVQELAGKLAEAGKQTEDAITKARSVQDKYPDPNAYYEGEKRKIFSEQGERITAIFGANPQYANALKALRVFTQNIRENAGLTDNIMHYLNSTADFCLGYAPSNQAAAIRRNGSQLQ